MSDTLFCGTENYTPYNTSSDVIIDDVLLSGVEDTCFIPFAGRVAASEQYPNYFYDPKAINYAHLEQIKRINKDTNEHTILSIATRFYHKDTITREFLAKHTEANIVCLGAGLETMNYRFKEANAHFYQIDFQSVLDSRKKILGKAENETYIACDITDMSWTKQIDTTKPILLVASGVFLYIEPETITKLLADLKKNLPGAYLLFDTLDTLAVSIANKIIKKTGNDNAVILFALDDEHIFCKENGLELVDSKIYFKKVLEIVKGLKFVTKLKMKLSDMKRRAKILLVRI